MNLTYSELKKQVLACATPAKAYATFLALWPEFQESLAGTFQECVEESLFAPSDLVTMTGLSFTQISHNYSRFCLRTMETKLICYTLLRMSVHAFVAGPKAEPPLPREMKLLQEALEHVDDVNSLTEALHQLEEQVKNAPHLSEQQLLLERIQECAWDDFDMAWNRLSCVPTYRRLLKEGPEGNTNWLLKFPIYLSIILDRPVDYFITQDYLDPVQKDTPAREKKAQTPAGLRKTILTLVLYLPEQEKVRFIADFAAKYGGDAP